MGQWFWTGLWERSFIGKEVGGKARQEPGPAGRWPEGHSPGRKRVTVSRAPRIKPSQGTCAPKLKTAPVKESRGLLPSLWTLFLLQDPSVGLLGPLQHLF